MAKKRGGRFSSPLWLLPFATSLTLWTISYLNISVHNHTYHVYAWQGALRIEIDDGEAYAHRSPGWGFERLGYFGLKTAIRPDIAFRVIHSKLHERRFTYIRIPFWVSSVLCAIPLWGVIRAHLRRQYIRQGLCISCGYDLRGSGDQCPECAQLRLSD